MTAYSALAQRHTVKIEVLGVNAFCLLNDAKT